MSTALEEVAHAADEVAQEQRQVARRARTMQRQRDAGWSWARILDRDADPTLIELLRRSARTLTEALGRYAQAVASGLSGEGETRRQIGRRLSVSHQRVTAMLNGQRGDRASTR